MNRYTESIGWVIFGVLLGTFANDWLYFLTIGVIGLLFMIYGVYYEKKFALSEDSE